MEKNEKEKKSHFVNRNKTSRSFVRLSLVGEVSPQLCCTSDTHEVGVDGRWHGTNLLNLKKQLISGSSEK